MLYLEGLPDAGELPGAILVRRLEDIIAAPHPWNGCPVQGGMGGRKIGARVVA